MICYNEGVERSPMRYRVTDGTSVVGAFRSRRAAAKHLAESTIIDANLFGDHTPRPLSEAGFTVRDNEEETA
jgi:hypothetical protein